MKKTLVELKAGHKAEVVEVQGGIHLELRLSSMGLVVGKMVKI